jgi:hypothetical protein
MGFIQSEVISGEKNLKLKNYAPSFRCRWERRGVAEDESKEIGNSNSRSNRR